MSATLPNLDVLALWLGSELYHTDFRPVPLQEMVKVGSVVYDAKSKASSRDLKQAGVAFPDDADHIIFLSIETITSGHGVLIFCPSKNWCENLATNIAKEIYNAGRPRDVADGNFRVAFSEFLTLLCCGFVMHGCVAAKANFSKCLHLKKMFYFFYVVISRSM